MGERSGGRGAATRAFSVPFSAGKSGEFELQFPVAVETCRGERLSGDRGLDGAAGFPLVGAVAEAAPLGEVINIVEDGLNSVVEIPELDFTHPGRVEDQRLVRQKDQFAMAGGVVPPVLGTSPCAAPLRRACAPLARNLACKMHAAPRFRGLRQEWHHSATSLA